MTILMTAMILSAARQEAADNGVLITAVSVVLVAIISSVIAPMVADRVKERRDNDPMRGWRTAYTDMAKRVDTLETEVKQLREEVNTLESTVDAQRQVIAEQATTIERQSAAIVARDNRITQLETAWPDSVRIPTPDPAAARMLGWNPT